MLAACGAPARPALIADLAALPVQAKSVEVTFLDNPDYDRADWWEIHYTTDHPKETVDAVRHVFIPTGWPIDDVNDGYGFTATDAVDMHEIYTTDEATTRLVVRINASAIGADGYIR